MLIEESFMMLIVKASRSLSVMIVMYIYTVQATDQHRDEEKLFYINDTRRKDSSWGLISSNDVTLGRATPTFRS